MHLISSYSLMIKSARTDSLVTMPVTPMVVGFLDYTTLSREPVKSALTNFEQIEAWFAGLLGSSLESRVEMY